MAKNKVDIIDVEVDIIEVELEFTGVLQRHLEEHSKQVYYYVEVKPVILSDQEWETVKTKEKIRVIMKQEEKFSSSASLPSSQD